MEFVLSTDLSVLPKEIGFNFEQLKQELAVNLERYRTLVVTEDAIRDAKGDRAKLNKLKTALEDKRKEVRAQCLKPYGAFADKVSEIVKMIEEPIKAIDTQVKVFDEAKKQEKREQIEDFFVQHVGECADYITFEQAFNPRWLNATYAIGDIHNEIMACFVRIEDDLEVIRNQKSDFEAEMLEEYAQTQSINKALAKKMALDERRTKIEAARRTVSTEPPVEAQAPDAVPAGSNGPEASTGEKHEVSYQAFTAPAVSHVSEETKTIKVVFYDTTAAFRAEMKALTEKHGIEYGGVK